MSTAPYTVQRIKTGRLYSLAVVHPNGNTIKCFGDNWMREAQSLCNLLNDAYALGRVEQRESDSARAAS